MASAAVFAFVALLALVAPIDTNAARCKTVYQQLASNPSFSTLKAAVDAAGLKALLDQPLQLTLLAPTNQAFGLAGASTGINFFAQSPAKLTTLIYNHIVPGIGATKAGLFGKNGVRLYTLASPNSLLVTVQTNALGKIVTFDNSRGPSFAPAIVDTPGLYDVSACGGAIIQGLGFVILPGGWP